MGELQLKRCPHCGGDGDLHINYGRKQSAYFVFIKCSICGAQGKIFSTNTEPESIDDPTVQGAFNAWNMRFDEKGERE